jgi:hypothetical protein
MPDMLRELVRQFIQFADALVGVPREVLWKTLGENRAVFRASILGKHRLITPDEPRRVPTIADVIAHHVHQQVHGGRELGVIPRHGAHVAEDQGQGEIKLFLNALPPGRGFRVIRWFPFPRRPEPPHRLLDLPDDGIHGPGQFRGEGVAGQLRQRHAIVRHLRAG